MATWAVKGKYKNRGAEKLDTAQSERAAQRLAGEYAMAFGPDWTIWVEEPRRRGQKQAWRTNPARDPSELFAVLRPGMTLPDSHLVVVSYRGGPVRLVGEYSRLASAQRQLTAYLGDTTAYPSADWHFWITQGVEGAQPNPAPYELRHYVVKIAPSGAPAGTVKIGKRLWTPDWSEATARAAELNAVAGRGRSGYSYEVVSEPVYGK